MKAFLKKHLDDGLILGGCALIVLATYEVSWIAAIYAAGIILVILGVLVGIGNGRTQS
jgi:hypothetical protein